MGRGQVLRADNPADLASIAVHPEHQHRGAGSLLLQWGVNIAEQFDIPIYTEASKSGYGLYEKMGFERLTHVRLIHPADVIGGDEDVEIPLVVRLPNSAKGVPFEEWAKANYREKSAEI